ncbi:unnamed protein product [Effrenium voratum]|nr:unnamed protein product [Effrenium voratum]
MTTHAQLKQSDNWTFLDDEMGIIRDRRVSSTERIKRLANEMLMKRRQGLAFPAHGRLLEKLQAGRGTEGELEGDRILTIHGRSAGTTRATGRTTDGTEACAA